MIPRQSLVPGAVHPVIVLQVADDRFQTGPLGGQPLEPDGLFVRTLGLSLAGNRHLGNLLQEVRYPRSTASLFGRDPVAFTQSSSASPRVVESCRLRIFVQRGFPPHLENISKD